MASRRRAEHIVRDIVVGTLQNVVKTNPEGFKRALLEALRGRDGFRTLETLARLTNGMTITFGTPAAGTRGNQRRKARGAIRP